MSWFFQIPWADRIRHTEERIIDPGALQYVDFYADSFDNTEDDALNFARPAPKEEYSKYIAEWQTVYYSQNKDNFITVNVNNEFKLKKVYTV